MNKPFTILISLFLLSVIASVTGACHRNRNVRHELDRAESLMNSAPDSALALLDSIPAADIRGREAAARYALLKSIALDKNYIDTTTFDVLQPAIDYYLTEGTPDEQLCTYYYQGRIYQNKGDFDSAMQSFLKGDELKNDISDTLIYANLLVAQGSINYNSYQIDSFISKNITAAKLYRKIGNVDYEFSSQLKALNGYIINNDQQNADSLLDLSTKLASNRTDLQDRLIPYVASYNLRFGNIDEIKSVISTLSDISEPNNDTQLDMALGYFKINNPQMAKAIIDTIKPNKNTGEFLKYLSIKSDILEALGDYENAFRTYKAYATETEKENSNIYLQKSSVAKMRHNLNLENIYQAQEKRNIIYVGVIIVFLFAIIISYAFYRLKIGKAKNIIIEKEKVQLQLENAYLQKENEMLELEKHNSKLECERQILASENLKLRISTLEDESDNLKELLSRNEFSLPVINAVKERIEILNGLLAAKISDNDIYSKPYNALISKVIEDRANFMTSTRLAFKVSHPHFITYLEEHGLSESEINYTCLYAIGLRGKEVGEYLQLKRHYHISSDIRKKLGIDEHNTNLGIYIRKLLQEL